jgi:hypothetical protein
VHSAGAVLLLLLLPVPYYCCCCCCNTRPRCTLIALAPLNTSTTPTRT